MADGLTIYLHSVPHARRAIGLPKHASARPGDAELRQISNSVVLRPAQCVPSSSPTAQRSSASSTLNGHSM